MWSIIQRIKKNLDPFIFQSFSEVDCLVVTQWLVFSALNSVMLLKYKTGL